MGNRVYREGVLLTFALMLSCAPLAAASVPQEIVLPAPMDVREPSPPSQVQCDSPKPPCPPPADWYYDCVMNGCDSVGIPVAPSKYSETNRVQFIL